MEIKRAFVIFSVALFCTFIKRAEAKEWSWLCQDIGRSSMEKVTSVSSENWWLRKEFESLKKAYEHLLLDQQHHQHDELQKTKNTAVEVLSP